MENQNYFNFIKDIIDDFISNEYWLIQKKLNERTLTSYFWYYIKRKLENCDIIPASLRTNDITTDHEYNKFFDNPKSLYNHCETCTANCEFVGTEKQDVSMPDILVHRRGSIYNDEIVIEVKKRLVKKARIDLNADALADLKKLKNFTCDHDFYRFKLGLFIEFRLNSYYIVAIEHNEIKLKEEFIYSEFTCNNAE